MRRIKLFFWFLIARFFDWLVRRWMKNNVRRYGGCKRAASFSEEEVKKATDTANPARFFDYFFNGTDRFSIQEKAKEQKDDLTRIDISFPSPFTSTTWENNTVYAAIYRSKNRPSPLVTILVGTYASSYGSFEHRMARSITGKAIDCCVIALPYCAGRKADDTQSGFCYISDDPVSTAESWIQSVMDLNRLYEVLKANYGYQRIGIVGICIGATATHASTFLKPYEGAVLITGGAIPLHAAWNAKGATWDLFRKNMGHHRTFQEIETIWTMSDTTKYTTPNLCKRFLMFNGPFDTFYNTTHAFTLNRSIKNCPIIWYPSGHYNAFMFMKPAIENIVKFFRNAPLRETALYL